MKFNPNTLYYVDGYKISHKRMLAKNTTKLYGSWIPRSLKYAPKGISKIVSFGQQLTVKWLNDEFNENFFKQKKELALSFAKDMSLYLMQEYDGSHFEALHDLGYLPIRIKSLPEGIETNANIPHMTFVNTVDGFGWLTLYLETIISSLAWKPSTSATIALQYRRNALKWVKKTDPANLWLVDFMCHDFSARGLSPWDMLSSGLGHATSHKGSDTLMVIPGSRYFYNEYPDSMPIYSVNASEHSVSTTKIFTVGEQQMLSDWLKEFPKGILSVVSDTFDLWKLITKYLFELKEEILSRDGKLVIRPDSGDPVDILCGIQYNGLKGANFKQYWEYQSEAKRLGYKSISSEAEFKGVIELLWDIFGGTVNEQGYKVLDSHIGAIYGDSINLERQEQIYERLAAKGFASTNIVLGVGSYTYQYNTRDTLGFAAKGCWFETDVKEYDIYKDPVTDDGTKKSKKGLLKVIRQDGEYICFDQQTKEQEREGVLQTIFENGKLYNLTSLTEVRERLNKLSQ